MYNFILDAEKRIVTINSTTTKNAIVVAEYETLIKKFLPNTADEYECELVLLEVEKTDELGEKTGIFETKAFSRRKGNTGWLMEFEPNDFIF
ncbi:MAG: hypothetical protein ACRC6E_02385 [Fusobacteriaceae bacterium]